MVDQRSNFENALIIQELCYWQICGKSLDSSIKLIKEIHGGDYHVYKETWNYWLLTQSVDVKDNKSKRGTTLEINDIVANLSR